jgi:hypothetical protein
MIEYVQGIPYFRFRYTRADGAVFWCFDRQPLEDLRTLDQKDEA